MAPKKYFVCMRLTLFLLVLLVSPMAQACAGALWEAHWENISQRILRDPNLVESLKKRLGADGRGYAFIDVSRLIGGGTAERLFEFVPYDGRHTVVGRPEGASDALPEPLIGFTRGLSKTILDVLNQVLKDVEPRPLRLKLAQIRRYKKGVEATREKDNKSERMHTDGSKVYLRAFVTFLGPGLIVGERDEKQIWPRQVPRAVICVFSSNGRTLVHPRIPATLHRGPSTNGFYDSDRFSIVVDLALIPESSR